MAVGSSDGFQELQLNEFVAEDSMDFDAWTTLISTVESMYNDDINKISLVYDSFLSEFPLCYGYWKIYAEHHARLCSVENVVQVFERAVESAPYSVGVWVDYCSFSISSFEDPSDVCRLFERGLSFVGKDYLCNLLWDKYIEFEYSQQHWDSLATIYLQTLKFPTKKLHQYYESFKKLVSIWEEETRFQEGSHAGLQSKFESDDESMVFGDAEICHVVSDLLDLSTRVEALQKYRTIGEFFYRKACVLDAKVRKFEQNIHRPYFHVKPLNDSQLQNWHRYLDFVEMEGDFDWAVTLHERCLISCAHYPEFWMRYVDFMESKGGKEICTDALDRATNIFLKNSSEIHLFNAWFKEKHGDIEGAHVAVLQCDQDIGSHFIDLVRRKANMEKRMGNYDKAFQIYKDALDLAKLKRPDIIPILYVHYARLQYMITNTVEAAREVLINGIECEPLSKLLLKELLWFSLMHDGAKQVDHLDSLIARALTCGSDVSGALSTKDREGISALYLEFIDSCGSIHDIRRAWNRHLKLFPHLVRVQSPLKKSAKAGAILQMVAEGRPDFFDLQFQKSSMKDDVNHLIQPPDTKEILEVVEISDKKEQPVNGLVQFEQGDERLDCLEVEKTDASKLHINDKEAVEISGSNCIKKQQELVTQQETLNSLDEILLDPQNDTSPSVIASETPAVEAPPEVSPRHISSKTEVQDTDRIPLSSPVHPLDKDAVERCNESFSPPFTRRHKESSPISSPIRPSDREGSRFRPNSSKGRSEYGSPVNSGDRRDRSLSPRKRNSHGYSDRRYNRQRSVSPRRYNSRWNSEDRWNRERNQRRYSRYPDNSRGNRDDRTQKHHIVVVGNKEQSHNVQQHQVVGSAPQPQAQINQYPVPNNEQYGDAQNSQLYNQMWQYYYQQQLLLQQQQQPASQQPQPNQMPPLQQNPDPEQPTPTHPQIPSQQQLLQLHYQQQQLYQQQLLQQQTNEQIQLPQQQLYQTLPLQQQEQQQQQQSQLQEQPQMQQQQPLQLQQQQTYQYQQLQQQQYLLYLQQLHQYQQSQLQSGLVQDQTLFQKSIELPENQQDQQLLPGPQHKKEELSSQKDDCPSEVDSMKGNHDQNPPIDHHASTSGATGQLKSQDQLPEIE